MNDFGSAKVLPDMTRTVLLLQTEKQLFGNFHLTVFLFGIVHFHKWPVPALLKPFELS